MNMLRVLIVDDEKLSRRRLRRLLARDTSLELVAECPTAEDALRCLDQNLIDIVFLDIQMPGMDGFALLESVGSRRTWCAIFVTAHDNFALRAFDVQAFDYLLKPYDDERLSEAVRRAKVHLTNSRSSQPYCNGPQSSLP
jgi:two-component system LytT family response regulator